MVALAGIRCIELDFSSPNWDSWSGVNQPSHKPKGRPDQAR